MSKKSPTSSDGKRFETFRAVIVAGIDRQRNPPLFPTLIVESEEKYDLNVFDSPPDYSQIREVVAAWATRIVKTTSYCLAFATGPAVIELHIRDIDATNTWIGKIDAVDDTVTWEKSNTN